MTVVVGTALRPDGAKLEEVAGLLAERLGTRLRLVHVCEDPMAPLVLGTDQESLLGDIRAALTRRAESVHAVTGATVQPHLASGSVVNALVSLAHFELATVLIMGPTTRWLRNAAERVSRSSRVPVLVLRDPEAFVDWLRGGRTLRILVGVDLGRAAESARRFAAMLASIAPAEVEVVYVASPEETHARLGLARPVGGLSAEAESALIRNLTEGAPPEEVSSTIRVIAGYGRADAHLVARADRDEDPFDVLVVGQRKRSLLEQVWQGSVARGVLQSAAVSVATVPAPVAEPDRAFRPPQVVVMGAELIDTDHRVLLHAIGIATSDATIHIVHVLRSPENRGAIASSGSLAERTQERDVAYITLSDLARGVAPTGHTASLVPHVLEGEFAESLIGLATRLGASVIVLGARHRTAIDRVMQGTLARAVVDASPIPVLLVPERGL